MRKIEINVEDKEATGMQHFHVLAKQEEGVIVGIGYGSVDNSNTMYLHGLTVFHGFRRNGIGRQIVSELENIGRNLGATQLEGDFVPEKGMEENVRIFYERQGFNIGLDRTLSKKLN